MEVKRVLVINLVFSHCCRLPQSPMVFFFSVSTKQKWDPHLKEAEKVVVVGCSQRVLHHQVSAAWNGFLLYIPVLTDISGISSPVILYFHCAGFLITHPPPSETYSSGADVFFFSFSDRT